MRGQCLNVSCRNRFALDCIERNTLMLACSAGISLRLDFHVGVEKKIVSVHPNPRLPVEKYVRSRLYIEIEVCRK
jgi:hypothetical protein